MRRRRFGIRRRSAAAAAIAVVLAAAAFTVALIANVDSQHYSRELSQRLVPALTVADGNEQTAALDALNRAHDVLLGALVLLILLAAAIATGVIIRVWRTLLIPLGQLNEAVAAVVDGDYRRPIPNVGPADPADLADLSTGVELMRTRLVSTLAERQRADENVRRLFELAPDAMIAVARSGTITMANARAGQLFRYPAHELVGCQAETLLPEDARAALAEPRLRLLNGTLTWPAGQEIMVTGLRGDGTTFPAAVRLSLLPTDNGTTVVAAVNDDSTRLALTAERERLDAAAEQEGLERPQRQSQQSLAFAGDEAEPDLAVAGVAGHGELVLLVEDEENQPSPACTILTENGYRVCEAADGADAVRRAQDPGQRIDLLVTDMVMPGMLGSEVVSLVRAIRPRLPAVFITGYARVTDYQGIRLPRPDILEKPFTDADLLSHVRRALDRSRKQASVPKQAPPSARETHIPSD